MQQLLHRFVYSCCRNVSSSFLTVCILGFILFSVTPTAFPLDIVLDFNDSANDSYTEILGVDYDQQLMNHFGSAEIYWEDIFLDDWTVEIEYFWDDLQSDRKYAETNVFFINPLTKTTTTRIRVNNLTSGALSAASYWVDETPLDHSEFGYKNFPTGPEYVGMRSKLASEYENPDNFFIGTPPPVLETGYSGTAATLTPAKEGGQDLFSLVIHEMGHALGMNSLSYFNEQWDGAYLLEPSMVWGYDVSVKQADYGAFPGFKNHLSLLESLMAEDLPIVGHRKLASATDILAIASGGDWTQVDIPRKDFLDAVDSDWTTAANWIGNRVPDSNDDVYIRHGGSVSYGDLFLYVGDNLSQQTGSINSLSVSGTGSILDMGSGSLWVGQSSPGTVSVRDGGKLMANWTFVSNGHVIVEGEGSLLSVRDNFLWIWDSSSMTIRDGGRVETGLGGLYQVEVFIGAELTVEGVGSELILPSRSSFTVNDSGIVLIADGGYMSCAERAEITSTSSDSGIGVLSVTGPGSTADLLYDLHVNRHGSGKLSLQDGGLVTVANDVFFDTGTNGEGILEIGFGPDGPGFLDITGNLTIRERSTLEISLDANANLLVGEFIKIVEFGGDRTGVFTTIVGNYLGNGFGFEMHYNPHDITLEFLSVLPGDFDVNGIVDGLDFLKWQRDPTIGQLSDWQSNYGMGVPPLSASTAVPEPTTYALALAALCLAMSRRRIAAR